MCRKYKNACTVNGVFLDGRRPPEKAPVKSRQASGKRKARELEELWRDSSEEPVERRRKRRRVRREATESGSEALDFDSRRVEQEREVGLLREQVDSLGKRVRELTGHILTVQSVLMEMCEKEGSQKKKARPGPGSALARIWDARLYVQVRDLRLFSSSLTTPSKAYLLDDGRWRTTSTTTWR